MGSCISSSKAYEPTPADNAEWDKICSQEGRGSKASYHLYGLYLQNKDKKKSAPKEFSGFKQVYR